MSSSLGPIIVPLDGSKGAEQALDDTKIVAEYSGAPVVFVHVVDPDDFPGAEQFAKARETFVSYAEGLAKTYGLSGVETHVAEGKAGQAILRYAREHQASMIILATHGRGGFQATFLGFRRRQGCPGR